MSFVHHSLAEMIESKPEEATRKICEAYRAAFCHLADTAEVLGCGRATLFRWIAKLGIEKELKSIEKRSILEGWHHGRLGGAGNHRDPVDRARKASATRRSRKKKAATGG